MDKIIEDIKKRIKETNATNNNELYKSHLYWSQKPYNICDILIENLSDENDIIMDPFMGSGVVLLEGLKQKYKRRVIGVEVNDLPIFIVKTLLDNYDLDLINSKINFYIKKVKEYDFLYDTSCSLCGSMGIGKKVLFDRNIENSTFENYRVYYKCNCNKKILYKDADDIDIDMMNREYNMYNFDDMRLITNTRLAVFEGEKISDIFTKRNLKAIDLIMQLIKDENDIKVKNCLKYILASIIHLCKITDTHSNSQWPLWIPKKDCVEKNVVELFGKRAKLLLKSLKYVDENISVNCSEVNNMKESNNYMIVQKGTQNLTDKDVPNESVDLIITDPPYLGQVLYSEYMQLYKPFLNFKFNLDEEIVISTSPERNKKKESYYKELEKAFNNISNKLKNDKYLCMYFHDSNLDVWNNIIEIMNSSGLEYVSQIHIKKKNTLKNILSPQKSLNGDSILFFKKTNQKYISRNNDSIEIIEKEINKTAIEMLKDEGALSTPELYDNGIMELIIKKGWLKSISTRYKSLVEVFQKELQWNKEKGKWQIKEAKS